MHANRSEGIRELSEGYIIDAPRAFRHPELQGHCRIMDRAQRQKMDICSQRTVFLHHADFSPLAVGLADRGFDASYQLFHPPILPSEVFSLDLGEPMPRIISHIGIG